MLGLSESGKSVLLAKLGSETTDDIQLTQGLLIVKVYYQKINIYTPTEGQPSMTLTHTPWNFKKILLLRLMHDPLVLRNLYFPPCYTTTGFLMMFVKLHYDSMGKFIGRRVNSTLNFMRKTDMHKSRNLSMLCLKYLPRSR
jgi:hypothetical protein